MTKHSYPEVWLVEQELQVAKEQGTCTVKPVLNGHSKIDKTKVLMTKQFLVFFRVDVFAVPPCEHINFPF